MTTLSSRLQDVGACGEARKWVGSQSPREAWENCDESRWMFWLIFRVMPRRRAVGVLVEVVRATCAHLAVDAVTDEVLNPLAAWGAGADVNVGLVRDRSREIWREQREQQHAAADADAADADAAYADAAAADAAYAAAAAADAAYAAYADAADAADRSAIAYADARAAQCDIIRALLPYEEIAAALGVTP